VVSDAGREPSTGDQSVHDLEPGGAAMGELRPAGQLVVGLGEFVKRERSLIWVQGAAAPRSRVIGDLAVAGVEPDRRISSRVFAGHQFGQ